MEIIIILIVLGVIAYILGQLDELLEGNPRWEKLKIGGGFLLMLPFAGLGLGAFIGHKMGFKEMSWQIVVVAIIFQITYYMLIGLVISSLTST